MNRRFLILALVVVLFSTFFTLSKPSVVHAACNTMTASGGPFSFLSVPITFNPGDSVTGTDSSGAGFVDIGAFAGPAASVSYTFSTSGSTSVDDFVGPLASTLTVVFCSGGGQVTTTNFTDGRLNSHDPWETSAVYCRQDGSIEVLTLAQPTWILAFKVTPAELAKFPKKPANHILIKQGHGVALYRLTNGQLQVNSPGLNPADGIYFFRFDECPLP